MQVRYGGVKLVATLARATARPTTLSEARASLVTVAQVLETPSQKNSVELTERAKDRLKWLRETKKNPELKLRLSVEGGGCSGFSYKFSVMPGPDGLEEDYVSFGEPPLVVDKTSLELVKGSKIDFKEDLIRRAFEVVSNPQSETKCGCGSSFSVKQKKM